MVRSRYRGRHREDTRRWQRYCWQRERWARTPRIRAVVGGRGGHEAVVKVLLATEKVEANPVDNYGWISLSWERRTGTRRWRRRRLCSPLGRWTLRVRTTTAGRHYREQHGTGIVSGAALSKPLANPSNSSIRALFSCMPLEHSSRRPLVYLAQALYVLVILIPMSTGSTRDVDC